MHNNIMTVNTVKKITLSRDYRKINNFKEYLLTPIIKRVVITNMPAACACALGLVATRIPAGTLTNYAALIEHGIDILDARATDNAVPANRTDVILFNHQQIINVMNAAGIPAGVRVLSALLYTFPFLRHYLAQHASLMTYAGALTYHEPLNTSQISIAANPSSHRYATLICLHLLTPAHSTEHKTVVQLYRRMSAAFTGARLGILTQTEVGGITQSLAWKQGSMPAIIYGALVTQ